MKPKTIRDFLLTIEDETIRTEAIENAEKYGFDHISLEDECVDIYQAFADAFEWRLTPQGRDYWIDVLTKIENNTLKTREI